MSIENKPGLGLLGPVSISAELPQGVHVEQPTLIDKVLRVCESLQTQNDSLRQELNQQCLIRAVQEHKFKPKKRGRKPKSKTEVDNVTKKIGRPPVFLEETQKLLIEYVDTLRESGDFKTDKAVLIGLLLKRGTRLSGGRKET